MSSWRKNGQDLAQTSRKWRKKISNGESDGERKKYPSANPVMIITVTKIIFEICFWILGKNIIKKKQSSFSLADQLTSFPMKN